MENIPSITFHDEAERPPLERIAAALEKIAQAYCSPLVLTAVQEYMDEFPAGPLGYNRPGPR